MSQQGCYVRGIDLEGRLFSLGLLAGQLAAHCPYLALKLADAGFPRVSCNKRLDGLGCQLYFASFQPVVGKALANQVGCGNLFLLLHSVAGEADNLHAVPEGRGNGVQLVGRAQEHDLGKIKGNIEIVIGEGGVLLRIQNFQQGRLRIAPEVVAYLVQFVQHDNGIAGSGMLQGLKDASGHCAYIGTPVSADFSLIVHAAQGKPLEFSAEGSGDGFPEARFAYAWRAHKAQYGAMCLGIQLVNAQKFKDAVLDFVQAVVVFIQDGLGVGYVQIVLGYLFPGQFAQELKIGMQYGSLGCVRMHN